MSIIIVACPDQGTGNDPEALGLLHHLGPTLVNTLIVNLLQTWLMIYFGQGGLHSQSALYS